MRHLPLLAAWMLSTVPHSDAPSRAVHATDPLAIDATISRATVFLPVPIVRQSRNFTCGAASTQAILAYYGDDFREGQLAVLLEATYENGVSYRAIERFVRQVLNDQTAKADAFCALSPDERSPTFERDIASCRTRVQKDPSAEGLDFSPYALEVFPGVAAPGPDGTPSDGLTVAALEGYLRAGKPVLVVMQAWCGENEDSAWMDGNDCGHYVVVVGFDRHNYYLMDPVVVGSWTYLPKTEFVRRWHDEDAYQQGSTTTSQILRRFGMVISRRPAPPKLAGALPRTE